MHTFKVWAPLAQNVALRIGERDTPMQRGEGGWWHCPVETAGPDTDYFYVVDGGKPVPDPRSAFQPAGIHGPSRIVDHSSFSWTDHNWQARPLSSAIIYELHVGTFTTEGTFPALLSKLDYLLELGVTHLEIMPVAEFSGPWGWGYDGVDLFAPHHSYGTPDDLKKLIDTCHAKGLGVILDVVYNHLGPAGNYLSQFGRYFTEAYKTPWGEAVNLDHEGSHEVRRFFIDNALMWLKDYHFDGLRLDAVHAFVDTSAIHFLEQLSSEVDALSAHIGKHLFLIAESDLNNPRFILSREAGGYGMDAQWDDDFHHALHSVLTGERNGYYEDYGSIADLAKALQTAFVFDGTYSDHRKRRHGRPIYGLSGHHFVVCAQNHDQIGNRARGERLAHLVSEGRQKIAAAIVLTSPFVPMLFQGEEWGSSSPFQYFSQHQDAELGHRVSEGRKNEFKAFGWDPEEVPDPQSRETFEASHLKWNELKEKSHASLLEWHKKLIALRRSTSSLTDGRLDLVDVNFDEERKWIAIRRRYMEIVCNLASDSQAIPVSQKPEEVISSAEGWKLRPGLLEVPAESVTIINYDESVRKHFRQHAA